MPHIHTEPGQHDVTVSAWIFRHDKDGLKVFVHMHRKIQKYMQVGGHIELDETPWQSIAHELEEESGYLLSELSIYQPNYMPSLLRDRIVHPVPVFINTYQPVRDHYHTDISYAFEAKKLPTRKPSEHESQDTRWFTLDELEENAHGGDVLPDIVEAYKEIAEIIEKQEFHEVETSEFSLEEPSVNEVALEKVKERTVLELVRFGNPSLREVARQLIADEILSDTIQQLIADIRYTNQMKQYGVGLAAPQVGKSVALSVIGIKPTPTRPNLEPFDQVIINPLYAGIGRRTGMWEGCQSCGSGDDTLYGKALRYRKIKASWLDEKGTKHNEELTGFVAQVFQHETDHLNGVLFVDRVKDSSTYMMGDEYRKRIANKQQS